MRFHHFFLVALKLSIHFNMKWLLCDFMLSSFRCQAEARHGDILGHLLCASKIVAEKEGILDGFRVVINNGPGACKLSS